MPAREDEHTIPRMIESDPAETAPTVVVALGGHAFVRPGESSTYDTHQRNAQVICRELMTLVVRGYNIVVTHGNGPQVGNLLLRSEMAAAELPLVPLHVLVAQTEGSLGYYLQQALLNELRKRDVRRYVVTVVTQVLVDPDDPAFGTPTKPVGPFLGQDEAERRRDELGWVVGEDAGRGWRRLVPSPRPLKVVQAPMVREAARQGHIVVAAGGGGVPIVWEEGGDWVGVEAVIDKDLTSSVLATNVAADLLIILTAVDQVFINFEQENQQGLGAVTMAECERHIAEGHFPAGSMGPKVEAIHSFLQRGGKRGLITSAERLQDALDGAAGTHFIGRI